MYWMRDLRIRMEGVAEWECTYLTEYGEPEMDEALTAKLNRRIDKRREREFAGKTLDEILSAFNSVHARGEGLEGWRRKRWRNDCWEMQMILRSSLSEGQARDLAFFEVMMDGGDAPESRGLRRFCLDVSKEWTAMKDRNPGWDECTAVSRRLVHLAGTALCGLMTDLGESLGRGGDVLGDLDMDRPEDLAVLDFVRSTIQDAVEEILPRYPDFIRELHGSCLLNIAVRSALWLGGPTVDRCEAVVEATAEMIEELRLQLA